MNVTAHGPGVPMPAPRTIPFALLPLLLGCLLLSAITLRAAEPPGPPPPRSLAEAIAQLASPQWILRDAAQTYLLRQSPETRPLIEKALRASTDPEVVTRLKKVAVHLFLKAQTSFKGRASIIGISLAIEPIARPNDEEPRMSVAVNELQPGFPAAEVLRPGDRIIALNNVSFPADMSIEAFRAQINAMEPGQSVALTIIRGRDQFKVSVLLAGLPEQGAAILGDYMMRRTAEAAAYLESLDFASRSARTPLGPDTDETPEPALTAW